MGCGHIIYIDLKVGFLAFEHNVVGIALVYTIKHFNNFITANCREMEAVPLPTMLPFCCNAEQVPGYSTRRLQGLDVAPSDAKAMMRAKANKTRGASLGGGGGGGGAGTINIKASAGDGEGAAPGGAASKGVGAANRVVAAATRCE